MSHHYDEHDHDKLVRWRQELASAESQLDEFPAAALFLVKPQCTSAHEIFRKYRTVFEERNAPFENLVVFGMHGVSETVRGLLQQAGLTETELPVLLMAPTAELDNCIALTLPSGESLEGGDDPNGDGTCDFMAPWQDVLDRITITRDGRILRLMGVQGRRMTGVNIAKLAGSMLSVGA